MKRYKILIVIALIVVSIGGLYLVAKKAEANPLSPTFSVSTATATTSPAYLTPGTGTTTLTYDSYIPSGAGVNTISNFASLLIQYNGSSTVSRLNVDIEYSDDGIDWYQDGGTLANNYSTTTKPFDITTVNQFSWLAASSTLGRTTTSSATSTRIITIRTPVRYTRAVFTAPIGTGSGAIWAKMSPAKEVRN